MWFLLATALILAEPKPAEVFRQLDQLDPLETTKLPFVKVATGLWSKYGDDPPSNHYRYGFLLSEKDGSFTVRFLDLTCDTLQSTPAGTAEHERVGHTPQDMAELAREFARRLKLKEEDGGFDYYLSPKAPMDPRGEALLLARACEQRGLAAERKLIWKSFESAGIARREVADGRANALVMDFTNPELSHAQLLAQHQTWLQLFADQQRAKWVKEQADELKRIVAEKEARAKLPAKKLEEESPEDLIFALRDEYHPVKDRIYDGFFISTPVELKDDRPAARLQKLGLKAAPALIEALGDETSSRCVWYHSRYGGSISPIGVGWMAHELLEVISGLTFYGDVAERRDSWKRWWKSVSEKGEAATLAELAAAGDDSSAGAARRLLKGWPAAIEAVLTGVRKADKNHVREDLIKILAASKGEAATGFFLEELRIGPYLGARLTAAQALLDRDRREGIDVFMRLWERPEEIQEKQDPGVPAAVADADQFFATRRARSGLVEFLLSCGDPAAVALVTKDVMKQPSEVRDTIVMTLWRDSLEDFTSRATAPHKPEVEKSIEDALVQLLDDLTMHYGSFGCTVNGQSTQLSDPRSADLAAIALQQHWPERYSFDPKGPARLLDRRLIALKNTWRTRRDLPELPLPKPAEVKTGLHNTVAEVIFSGEAKDIPAKVRDQASSSQGKDLSAKALIELLLAAAESLPKGTGRVALIADRLGDGAGACLQVQVKAASKPAENSGSVHSHFSITGNHRVLGGKYGNGSRSSYDTPDDYEDEIKAMNKALSLPEEQTFEFRLELRFE